MTTGPNIRSRLGRIAAPAAITVVLAGGGPAAAGVRPAAPAGTISTVAGGVGGPAKASTVALAPCGVEAAGGSLYVGTGTPFVDVGDTVRKVNPHTDWLTTVAGADYKPGTGIPAIGADVKDACSEAMDRHGNLVLGDGYQVAVIAARTGTFYGQAMTAGDIYIVAGAARDGRRGSGIPATQAWLTLVEGVAVDPHGNLVISDSGSGHTMGAVVRVVAASSGRFYHQKMIAGDIYTVAGSRQEAGAGGDGGPARKAALGTWIGDVTVDQAGNLVIADAGDYGVRVVAVKTGIF